MPVDDVISRRLTLKVRHSEDIETFADPQQHHRCRLGH
jgi:hypothetical protein